MEKLENSRKIAKNLKIRKIKGNSGKIGEIGKFGKNFGKSEKIAKNYPSIVLEKIYFFDFLKNGETRS